MSRTNSNTRIIEIFCAVWAVQCTTGHSGPTLDSRLCPQSITKYYTSSSSHAPICHIPSPPLPPSSPYAPRLAARDSHPLGSRALFPKLRDTIQRSGTLCLEDARPRHSECLGDSEAARIRQSQFRVVNLPQGLATPEVGQEWE